jgi:hypothetical protein
MRMNIYAHMYIYIYRMRRDTAAVEMLVNHDITNAMMEAQDRNLHDSHAEAGGFVPTPRTRRIRDRGKLSEQEDTRGDNSI